jgi:hypothetical protein
MKTPLSSLNLVIYLVDEAAGMGKIGGRKSWEELLLQNCALALYSIMICYPVVYGLQLDLPATLISILSPAWRNPWTTTLCLLLDMLAHFVYLTWMIFVVHLVLSFILSFNQMSEIHIRKMR